MFGSRPRRLKRGHDRGKVILLIGPQSAEPDEGYDRGDRDLDDKPRRLALQGTQHRAGLSSSHRGEGCSSRSASVYRRAVADCLDGRLRLAQRHAVIPPSSIERLKPTQMSHSWLGAMRLKRIGQACSEHIYERYP